MNKYQISELSKMLMSEQEDIVGLALGMIGEMAPLDEGGMSMDLIQMLVSVRSTLMVGYNNEGKLDWIITSNGDPVQSNGQRLVWPEWRTKLLHSLFELIQKGYGWDSTPWTDGGA